MILTETRQHAEKQWIKQIGMKDQQYTCTEYDLKYHLSLSS
jgi:hypothetical protein